jgi:multidrug transporter EmrE-like cation transporter
VFNAGINFLFMVLAVMPASVVYPILSAGGTLITAVVAYFVYKEKLSPMQLVGLGVGIASIVLLNI